MDSNFLMTSNCFFFFKSHEIIAEITSQVNLKTSIFFFDNYIKLFLILQFILYEIAINFYNQTINVTSFIKFCEALVYIKSYPHYLHFV